MRPWHFSHGNHDGDGNQADGVESMEASMRPWHFSHGNLNRLLVDSCSDDRNTCFNEAVAFQPRKFHRQTGLELAGSTRHASMRPWHFSHGNFSERFMVGAC